MRDKFITLLTVLLLPVVGFAQDWVSFTSEEDGFSVQFPGKHEESTKQVTTDDGELALAIFAYEPTAENEDNLVYMVMVTEFPLTSKVSSDNKEDLPTRFRNAVDGGVKNVKGTLVSEKDIKIKGYPGREYKISYQEGNGVITGKMCLVKRRMYMIQTITLKETENNPSTPKFLNSFRLLRG